MEGRSAEHQKEAFSVAGLPADLAGRHLLEGLDHSVVRSLGAEVAVEQQRVGAGAPRVRVAHAPDGDADAGRHVQAGLGDLGVVVGRGLLDVELGDRDLLDAGGGEGL